MLCFPASLIEREERKMRTKHVVVEPYNPKWKANFEAIKSETKPFKMAGKTPILSTTDFLRNSARFFKSRKKTKAT